MWEHKFGITDETDHPSTVGRPHTGARVTIADRGRTIVVTASPLTSGDNNTACTQNTESAPPREKMETLFPGVSTRYDAASRPGT